MGVLFYLTFPRLLILVLQVAFNTVVCNMLIISFLMSNTL